MKKCLTPFPPCQIKSKIAYPPFLLVRRNQKLGDSPPPLAADIIWEQPLMLNNKYVII